MLPFAIPLLMEVQGSALRRDELEKGLVHPQKKVISKDLTSSHLLEISEMVGKETNKKERAGVRIWKGKGSEPMRLQVQC